MELLLFFMCMIPFLCLIGEIVGLLGSILYWGKLNLSTKIGKEVQEQQSVNFKLFSDQFWYFVRSSL